MDFVSSLVTKFVLLFMSFFYFYFFMNIKCTLTSVLRTLSFFFFLIRNDSFIRKLNQTVHERLY